MFDFDYTAPPPTLPIKRFTVDEYDRMIASGHISESSRTELLDGWMVEKMPHNAPRDSSVSRMNRRLARVLGDDWIVRIQSSARLDHSIPEPDVVVVLGPESRFDTDRPGAADIELLVEVSESSLDHDQNYKLSLYARNRLPIYWIVNLIDRQIEVYTQPKGGPKPGYGKTTVYKPGQDIPVMIAGKKRGTIAVNDILP